MFIHIFALPLKHLGVRKRFNNLCNYWLFAIQDCRDLLTSWLFAGYRVHMKCMYLGHGNQIHGFSDPPASSFFILAAFFIIE